MTKAYRRANGNIPVISKNIVSMAIDPTFFHKRMKQKTITIQGFPVSPHQPNDRVTKEIALQAFSTMREQASDVPEMNLEEINAEINDARVARKARKTTQE